jgi:predicted RND superfamily exporter protein
VFRPSLFCAITTVAGFLSLATSSIPPVQHLGYFSAAGVAFSFVLCFTLFPALLSLSKRVRPRGVEAQVLWSPARAEALAAWLQRRRIAILAFALVAFAFSIYGVYRIRVESHTLDFFPPSHRVPSNYFAIEKNLLGLTPIDIVVSGPREVLLSNAALNSYKQFFTRTLEQEPLARQVVSILLEPSRTPKLEFVLTPDELREAFATEDLPAAAKNFLRVDGDQLTLRTTVLTSTASSNEVFALINRLRARLAAEKLSPKVSAELTGLTPLLIEGQVRLLETQIQSFALAFAVIAVAVFFAFRSLSATLLVLLPNLLPITITLGYMGWAGIPLNTATVTVAGIALGLIVDDSIHFIHHFKHLPSGLPAGEAVAETLLHLARPIAITSLAVAGSFALFSLSPFLPTAYFGRLIAITATAALFGVLVFLPALLLVQNRRR